MNGDPVTAGRGGLSQLWAHRDFRLLLTGQAVSSLGDWMATVALMALVLDITGSSTAVGGILVLRLAPALVAGPLAGRIVDRWDRRRTMLAMDAVRIGIVVAIPLVEALWWVYLWAFLLEVGGLVFLPARDAAIPDVAGHQQLPLANGLVLGSSYGAIPLGAGAFAVVSALVGGATTLVFFIDAATFAVSFALIARIRLHEEGRVAVGPVPAAGGAELKASFTEAMRLPLVRAVGPSALVVSLGLGALFSLGIVFVRDVLGAGNTGFAVLIALFGVGAALGLAALQRVEVTLDVIRGIVGAQGAVVAGMSMAPSVTVAYAGAVGFGAATAAVLAGSMSVLQERLQDRRRVMAFTAFHVIIRGGLAVAALAAGAVADVIESVEWPGFGRLAPARVVLLCSGTLVFLTAVVSRNLTDAGRRRR